MFMKIQSLLASKNQLAIVLIIFATLFLTTSCIKTDEEQPEDYLSILESSNRLKRELEHGPGELQIQKETLEERDKKTPRGFLGLRG